MKIQKIDAGGSLPVIYAAAHICWFICQQQRLFLKFLLEKFCIVYSLNDTDVLKMPKNIATTFKITAAKADIFGCNNHNIGLQNHEGAD